MTLVTQEFDCSLSEEARRESVDATDLVLENGCMDSPGDIIANILHWCDHYNEDFEDHLRRGRDYHKDEVRWQKTLDK
jgi:hypothetical protein